MSQFKLPTASFWIFYGNSDCNHFFYLILHKPAGKSSAEADATAQTSMAVESVRPTEQSWPMRLTMKSSVNAWQEAQVSAGIGGLRIKQVLVDFGSTVKRGQDLVLLADETVVADVHKQQATVAHDKAALAEANLNADRAREIKESGALSSQQINQYLIAEETAEANLALSQAELENQQIRLRQTHLIAADGGVMSSRTANLGDVVSASGELFKLVRQNRINWRGEVSAPQLALIKAGQQVHLLLPDNLQTLGTALMTAPTVDTSTRNALVYVDLAKASAKPGMYSQVTIDIGSKPALAVPQTALVLRNGRSYWNEILPTKEAGKAQQVMQSNVTTGRRLGEFVEIVDGMQENPLLVVTGAGFLNDGDLVTVVNKQAAVDTQTGAAKWISLLGLLETPIPSVLLFVALTFIGLVKLGKLGIERFPDIEVPVICVSAKLEGAAPAQLETEVARKIEDKIATIGGIEHIRTTITDSSVNINVEFNIDKNSEEALNQVPNAVDSARSDLPSAVTNPVISKTTTSGGALLTYVVVVDNMSQRYRGM